MIEVLTDMPGSALGFRADGEITKQDYTDVLVPALTKQVQSGEDLRVLFVAGPGFEVDHSAWLEDVKTGLGLGFGHHSQWKRIALVTDIEWIAKATRMFAWLTPGEVRVFALGAVEDAKQWVAG